MLYPLIFILGAESFVKFSVESSWLIRRVEILFLFMGIVQGLGYFVVFFIDELSDLSYLMIGALVMIGLSALVVYLWFKQPQWRIYWAFAFIISFRIGFDLYVIPFRMIDDGSSPPARKVMAEKLLQNMKEDRPIKVFDQAPIYKEHAFYLGVARNQIIERTVEINSDFYYLVDDQRMKQVKEFESIHSHKMYYKDYDTHLCVVKEEFQTQKPAE
jgi:hypothetical protein